VAGPRAEAVPRQGSAERLARYARPGTLSFAALPPLALYVHLPWCLKKCPYCDFNSHEWRPTSPEANVDALPESRYLDALRADLEASLPFVWGRRIHSIFIGGGTPSLFTPESIDRLLADIRARLPLEAGCEITLEANPGTFERDRFRAFRAAGVTRLSIGVQSFDETKLRAIGRVHDAAQAHAAVAEAAAAFDTFNIDLMYALPGQTLAEWAADLDAALAYEPPHLSAYHLTIEANTLFAKHPPVLPHDDLAAEMLDHVVQRTSDVGLDRYEVSAYARPGHRCLHNLNYWQFGDYLGIGAGAHGKLSFPDRVTRHARAKQPNEYMKPDTHVEESVVSVEDLPFEFMLNALRLVEGFDIALFRERTGLPIHLVQSRLDEAEKKGLVARDWKHIRPTERGRRFLNDLLEAFLPDRRAPAPASG